MIKMNKIYNMDNLELMKQMNIESVDLIYCDILYNTGKKFKDYSDKLGSPKEAIEWYKPRLIEMHRILKNTGSIYLHCDWHLVHYLKCEMDSIFGYNNLSNEIIWQRTRVSHSDASYFGKVHDTVLFYRKSKNAKFNPQYIEHSDEYIKRFNKDDNGRKYMLVPLHAPSHNKEGEPRIFWEELIYPPKGRMFPTQATINELINRNLIEKTSNNTPCKKSYLDENKGKIVSDFWDDIIPLNPMAKERVDYYSQKPKALLERIIKSSSNENDVVADFFCGSGTSLVVAKELNRQYIGCDISERAVNITYERLTQV